MPYNPLQMKQISAGGKFFYYTNLNDLTASIEGFLEIS